MPEIVNMSEQFKGLPMGELIGGPLSAACDAQVRLAQATADFIRVVGFLPKPGATGPDDVGDTRQAVFRFKRPADGSAPTTPGAPVTITEEEVELSVPLLSIVRVPNLAITAVGVTFDMEVKSSFTSKESSDTQASLHAEAGFKFGLFSGSVKIQGSVATHKENTRSSDNSAKYHVEVRAEDRGMPEGLARVMDILQTASAPRRITPVNTPQLPPAGAPAGAPVTAPAAAPVAAPATP